VHRSNLQVRDDSPPCCAQGGDRDHQRRLARAVLKPLKDAGCLVLADVASVRHARRLPPQASMAGAADRGAGGQTGWSIPCRRARRADILGRIVVMRAAWPTASIAPPKCGLRSRLLGTKFIATRESLAKDPTRRCWSKAMDDVLLTRAFTGLETKCSGPRSRRPDSIRTICRCAAPSIAQGHQRANATSPRPNAGRHLSAGHRCPRVGRTVGRRTVERTEAEYRSARSSPA